MPDISREQLVRWSEALAGLARTGLAFETTGYERERLQEILEIAADIAQGPESDDLVSRWMNAVEPGIPGYATPKSAAGAFVGNDAGELLLIQRSDSGKWFVPTGWADIGYSLAEIAIKEVHEETGIVVEPLSVASVVDGLQAGAPLPFHTVFFTCRAVGGELRPHPLECLDVGWFAREALPEPLLGNERWCEIAFDSIADPSAPTRFDAPRDPVWRD